MKNKILAIFGVLTIFTAIAWALAAPNEKIKPGDTAPTVRLTNIHDAEVAIPSSKAKWVHLQFRRFAGCPICNLHIHSFVERNSELVSAGIEEVVVFHSPKESLLPYQGKFPFDVIADPEKNFMTNLE